MTGLVYLEDPVCYADCNVATGRVSLAEQDEGERSDKERYPGPPGWEFSVGQAFQHSLKMFCSYKPYTKP